MDHTFVYMRGYSCPRSNPPQDDPQKRDPTLAPSGGLRIAKEIYSPGLRLARPVRRNGSLDQPLLRFRLRYTNGLVRTHTKIVLDAVVGVATLFKCRRSLLHAICPPL